MKKIIIAALIIMASCTNPEDRATGDTDSTHYNAKENETPNSGDFNKPLTATGDTSGAPTLEQKNANSPTQGTNRPYGTKDSTK